MKAWKHHIAKDFIENPTLIKDNGAGVGGTVFLSYPFMLGFLWLDRGKWYICELEIEEHEIERVYDTPFMAFMKVEKLGSDFKPLI